MNIKFHTFILILFAFNVLSCNSSSTNNSNIEDEKINNVNNIDSINDVQEIPSTIKTVTIGAQTWMAENLNVKEYRNGDPIPVFKNIEQWKKFNDSKKGSCAVYGNDSKNEKKYGHLYNWYAVTDPRGICPEGFRVPKEEDFEKLLFFVDSKNKHNTDKLLNALLDGGNTGFNALLGGWCCMDTELDGVYYDFVNMGQNAAFWTNTASDEEDYAAINLDLGSTWRSDTYGAYLDSYSSKDLAFSVRCIKE